MNINKLIYRHLFLDMKDFAESRTNLGPTSTYTLVVESLNIFSQIEYSDMVHAFQDVC